MITFHPDPLLAKPVAHPEWFDGRVRMHFLTPEPLSTSIEVIAVYFDVGARTVPHVHTTDQMLYVVEGRCAVADGANRRELAPGECAFIPAGEWHWHGAAPGHSACHLSIRAPGPTDWTVEKRDW